MKKYVEMSEGAIRRAEEVLRASKVKEVWEAAGAEVRRVGSIPMGLLAKHKDIDLHVYSSGITEENSFAVIANLAKDPNIIEIKCINGLHTPEHCIAWHLKYKIPKDIAVELTDMCDAEISDEVISEIKSQDDEFWQIDIIHIEKGTEFDGYFEEMARRIKYMLTDELRDLILKLKYETPDSEEIHGVEYYEAVLADGVRTLPELREWLKHRRSRPFYYWMPEIN